jgi:hypothetical protein
LPIMKQALQTPTHTETEEGSRYTDEVLALLIEPIMNAWMQDLEDDPLLLLEVIDYVSQRWVWQRIPH